MAVLRIRAPKAGDGAGIGRVHVRAWQQAYQGLMPSEFLDGLDEVERGRAWEQRLAERRAATADPRPEDDGSELLVAELDGEIVGIATIGPERDPDDDSSRDGELWMINIDPEAWGQGVGSALLAAATEMLTSRGYATSVLWVIEGNDQARRFYERHGWHPDGGRKTETFAGRPVAELRYHHTFGG